MHDLTSHFIGNLSIRLDQFVLYFELFPILQVEVFCLFVFSFLYVMFSFSNFVYTHDQYFSHQVTHADFKKAKDKVMFKKKEGVPEGLYM